MDGRDQISSFNTDRNEESDIGLSKNDPKPPSIRRITLGWNENIGDGPHAGRTRDGIKSDVVKGESDRKRVRSCPCPQIGGSPIIGKECVRISGHLKQFSGRGAEWRRRKSGARNLTPSRKSDEEERMRLEEENRKKEESRTKEKEEKGGRKQKK